MTLQEKIIENFEGKVVRKDLTAKVKGNAVVPSYVLEYLLGQNCAIADDEIIKQGIEKVLNIIKNNYVHRSEAEIIKSRIREAGNYKIIDKINVELNDKLNIYEADFSNLGIKNIPISDDIVKKNKKLLSGGGVWSILSMEFNHSDDATIRWEIHDLKPIQVADVDLNEYLEIRKKFTSDEWIDLLMHSIGLDPEFFNKRGKLIQLSRLITHTENNFNLIELGPKGTGKSHIFSELSPHGVLVSGGDVSKARLFVNNVGNKIGLVGYWDVVALDEFEQEKGSKRVDGDLVKIMQNYLANQSFNRGKESYQAQASMAFIGNTKHSVPYMLKNSHLFESIPDGYIKGAFLDRMYMYVPGWEVRILKESVFSKDYGFIVDYMAEILKELRKYDYTNLVDNYVDFDGSLTKRDKLAIRKSFSGLVKIIYPNKDLTQDEALELIDFAVEGRKRVKDQLFILDETFRDEPVDFKYKVKSTGKEVEVETLEKINYKTDKEEKIQQLDKEIEPKKEELAAKQIGIIDNQTGISYRKLFADYLVGSADITLTDPYIRYPYQFKNLFEFCVMLGNNKEVDEEINLNIISWNEELHMRDSVESFEEIKESVLEIGINLTYDFKELHDREITSDTGWKILLGRGLDIFEPFEGKFNVALLNQEKRKCKNCSITFLKE